MLTKKTIEALAKISRVPVEKIIAALADAAEVELPIDETISAFTADEITQRDNNIKTSGKKEWEQVGEEKGKELATKAIKTKLGITDTSKDPDFIAGIIQTKMAGETGLKDQVTLLQQELALKATEIGTLNANLDSFKGDTELLSLLPSNRSSSLETAEHLDIVKKNLEFSADGIKYKGEVLRNATTKAPLTKKEAVDHFYQTRTGLLSTKEPGGRGGGNSGGAGGTAKTMKDVRLAWEAMNPTETWGNPSSQEHLTKTIKENPDLVMEDDGK